MPRKPPTKPPTVCNRPKPVKQAADNAVNNAQTNLDTAQKNADNLANLGQAVKDAANQVTTAQNQKAQADTAVNQVQTAVNDAQTKLNTDQAKLDAANNDVPSNGDDSANGNFRLDDQYFKTWEKMDDAYKAAEQRDPNEAQRISKEIDQFETDFNNKWNPRNATNQELSDDAKIPASHTMTDLNDTYQSDPGLRRLLVKVGYQPYYTYDPSDPSDLKKPWVKRLVYQGDDRGLSINASINATNYVLELVNQVRKARGLAPLTTDMNAIKQSAQAIKDICNLPEPAISFDPNQNRNYWNQEQAIAHKYRFTDYDTDAGNNAWSRDGHQLGSGPEVDEATLPDRGWLSVDNLHRALFNHLHTEVFGDRANPNDHNDGIIGNGDFLLHPDVKSVAVQVGKDGWIYVFLYNPVQSATNTTALQNTVAQDKQALSTAQTKLGQAKAAQAKATTALQQAQDAYTKLTNGAQDPATIQANLATAKQNLTNAKDNQAKANAAVKDAQTKLDQAKTALTQAQAANDQAQTKLTSAQANLKQANDHLATLTKGNEVLLQAIQSVKDAQHNLDVAEAQIKADQDKLGQLTPAAKDAQAKLPSLKQALDDANAKLAEANANLITDAKVYGDVVEVNDATMHANEVLPSLTLKNQMAADPTQNELDGLMLKMASMPGDTIPTGTTVTFANPDKVKTDSQNPGDYTEDVLVTFPDGSTVTKQIKLHVDAAVAGLPNGWSIKNGQVVDANGQVIPGYTVDANGNVVKVTGDQTTNHNAIIANNGDKADTTNNAKATNGTNSRNAQLPQTGNANDAGLVALAGASLIALFGLAVTKKRA